MAHIETQSRKIISSYGGVGSIIETPNGAMLIDDFDRWQFFKAIVEGKIDIEDYNIEDERLINRLKHEKGFPRITNLLRVPSNSLNPNNQSIPLHKFRFVSAKYFPEWFYCSKCQSFHHISDWWKGWQQTLKKYKEPNDRVKESFFSAPKCFHCYDAARIKDKADRRKRKTYYLLEQVRFVLTNPKAELKDIPWDRWNTAKKVDTGDGEENLTINFEDELCCESPKLRYIKSTKFSDLAGIRIECANCKKKNTLAGLFKLKLVYGDAIIIPPPKVVIRSSNSVYYPILVGSIYLPTQKEITARDADKIDAYIEKGKSTEFILEVFEDDYSTDAIISHLESKEENYFEPEQEYRQKEYRFIIDKKDYEDDKRNFIFKKQNIDKLTDFGIDNLTQINRLKYTTVQLAYSRQESVDINSFLQGDEDVKIRTKYTSQYAGNTEFLPAIESYGEGIFVTLSVSKIENWFENAIINSSFQERLNTIEKNLENHDFVKRDKFKDKFHLAKFILIHTLSHILIKELEFLVGYSATSMQERLFIDEKKMSGILIYTIAGTEGSFGGLVSQGKDEVFERILKSALYRATDCSSDPICYNTKDGQGIGGLNMAACYSCTLLPETSCEEFNSFLDRAFLVDKEFGFFKQIND